MPEVDFLYFAAQGSPNVVPQATYAVATYIAPGLGSGILASAVFNKIVRQGSAGAAMLAQFIANQLNTNVLDNGNLTTLVTQLTQAIQQSATIRPARVVTASSTLTINLTDWYIGLYRNVGPAALNAQLPASPSVGQEFVLEDLFGNFNAYPVTILPSAGTTIKGKNSWVLNEDQGGASIVYAGSNIWGVRMS